MADPVSPGLPTALGESEDAGVAGGACAEPSSDADNTTASCSATHPPAETAAASGAGAPCSPNEDAVLAVDNAAPADDSAAADAALEGGAATGERGAAEQATQEAASGFKFGGLARGLASRIGRRSNEEPQGSSAAADHGAEQAARPAEPPVEGSAPVASLLSRFKPDYQFGDISRAIQAKPDYKFGDISRAVLSKVTSRARPEEEPLGRGEGPTQGAEAPQGKEAPQAMDVAQSSQAPQSAEGEEGAEAPQGKEAPRALDVAQSSQAPQSAEGEEAALAPAESSGGSRSLALRTGLHLQGLQDRMLSGTEGKLVKTLASIQEAGQAVSQAGARVQESLAHAHESAKQTGMRVQESITHAHESAKHTGVVVADSAQAAGQAVSSGVQSAIPVVQNTTSKVVATACEVHEDVVQAHREGGTTMALEKGAIHAAKASISAYAGYVGVTMAAKEKAYEAGALATQYVHDNVSEDRQKKLQEGASKVVEGAKYVARQVASHGESVIKQGYDTYVQAGDAMKAVTEEAYAGLPEDKRRALMEKRRRVDESKEHLKELGVTLIRPVWKSISSSAGRALRDSVLSDPDMWACVRRFLGPLVEALWTDIEEEVEKGLELSIYKDPVLQDEQAALGPLLRLRAFVLHHFLPCDRSIFGMLKDPVYLCFFGITCLPFWSARVFFYTMILVLLARSPDGVDEYQLVCFILSSKGMQFLTSGVANNGYGAAEYYYAIHFCDGDADCLHRHTPGQNSHVVFPVIDFFGSVCLVWGAFFLLPHSRKHGLRAQRAAMRQENMPDLVKSASRTTDPGSPVRGGRLHVVLRWDLVSFSLCALLLVVLQSVTSSSEFLANLFWCRVLYSLLSFPFFLFYLPGFRQLLTHAESTGFAKDGRCVPYKLRDMPSAQVPLLGAAEGGGVTSSPASAGAAGAGAASSSSQGPAAQPSGSSSAAASSYEV